MSSPTSARRVFLQDRVKICTDNDVFLFTHNMFYERYPEEGIKAFFSRDGDCLASLRMTYNNFENVV